MSDEITFDIDLVMDSGEEILPLVGTFVCPIGAAAPILKGEIVTGGTAGTEVLLPRTCFTNGYLVTWSWAEEPTSGSGAVWIEYGTNSFFVKNDGLTIGKKLRYKVEVM